MGRGKNVLHLSVSFADPDSNATHSPWFFLAMASCIKHIAIHKSTVTVHYQMETSRNPEVKNESFKIQLM